MKSLGMEVHISSVGVGQLDRAYCPVSPAFLENSRAAGEPVQKRGRKESRESMNQPEGQGSEVALRLPHARTQMYRMPVFIVLAPEILLPFLLK